jgi:predicted ATPase/DNA-binding CsgD family transcriptional regulator
MTHTEISVHLPEEPNRFIGREQELGDLRQALDGARALTLCGPGGIGKTRLALQVLASVADGFPDGVWLVELGDLREPRLVVSRVAAALGVLEEPGRPLIDTLAAALAPRRMLLAVDNCEHLIDASARLCQRLLASSPGLRVMATSQEPLRMPGEVVRQVAPLSVPPERVSADPAGLLGYEAIRLFADRAAAARPSFTLTEQNAQAVTAICRALDGVPLAIELAAARAGALSPEQIAGRLGDRFALLGSGDRTAPPRQRTLRATLDWSHALLNTQEQALLRRLSVFAGWSLEMAEQVCADTGLPAAGLPAAGLPAAGLRAADVLDLTSGLVDKSLVVVEPEVLGQARYRLLDTIRDYAAERLAASGESAAVHLRLREYALRFAQRAGAEAMAVVPAPWSATVDFFRRYDVDLGNLRRVLSACLADGDAETGLKISAAAGPCWIARGSFAEGAEWLGRFLALDQADLPDLVRGAALVGRAQLALANESAAAVSWAQEGLDLCRAAGDPAWTATALNLLADAAQQAGQMEQAQADAAEALAIARGTGNGWNEGYALGIQARLAGLSGRLREARELGEAGLAVMRRIDQQWGVAKLLDGLGYLARLRGDPAGSLDCYQAALPILREIDSRPETARCLAGIGLVALDEGQLDVARQHLTESLRLSHSTGARLGVARALEAFAALTAREGHADVAVELTAAAEGLREAAGFPPLPAARKERALAAARGLGADAVTRLWAQGRAMTADAAVAAALTAPDLAAREAGSGQRGAAGPPVTSPELPPLAGLTPRESEIAALIAGGLSNKGIADDLVISPATAARHVANILAKLGFTSRAQIAAWAAGNGSAHPHRAGNGAASSDGAPYDGLRPVTDSDHP